MLYSFFFIPAEFPSPPAIGGGLMLFRCGIDDGGGVTDKVHEKRQKMNIMPELQLF